LAEVARHWKDPWGDRRQEIVFIGAGMDRAALTAVLDAALIDAASYTPDLWAGLADPFPLWRRQQAA